MTLAIIGTAGRGPDARLLTVSHWRMMTCVAQTVACTLGADHLVSGGSAWADAVAVDLYLSGHAKSLTLHLPCQFQHMAGHFDRASDTGCRLNQLYEAFHQVTQCHPLSALGMAIKRGATIHVNPGGFKARNTDVARDADTLLAFTFGPVGTEGGTADTWAKFREAVNARFAEAREHYEESPCGCINNAPGPSYAYHFDLTTRVLARHIYEDPVEVAERAARLTEDERRKAEREIEWLASHVPAPRTPEEEAHDLL